MDLEVDLDLWYSSPATVMMMYLPSWSLVMTMDIPIGFVALVCTVTCLLVPPLYYLYQYRVSIRKRLLEIVSRKQM